MSNLYNVDVEVDTAILQEFVEDLDDVFLKIEILVNELYDNQFNENRFKEIIANYQDIALSSSKINMEVISEALSNTAKSCKTFLNFRVFSNKIGEILLLFNDKLLKLTKHALNTGQINLLEAQNVMVMLQTVFEAKNKQQCYEKVDEALQSIIENFDSVEVEVEDSSDVSSDEISFDFFDEDLTEDTTQSSPAEEKKFPDIIIADMANTILSMTEEYYSFLMKNKAFRLLTDITDIDYPSNESHTHLLLQMGLAVNFMVGEKIDPENYAKAICIHDLALVPIQDILKKPEKLSKEEFDLVKQHPIIATELAKEMHFSDEAIDIVRHHHERMDGSGYPDGLKYDEISDGVRLTAIIDSFHAMIHSRPHKKYSRSVFRAVSELNACAGSLYDKSWVDQFNKFLKDIWLPSQKYSKRAS